MCSFNDRFHVFSVPEPLAAPWTEPLQPVSAPDALSVAAASTTRRPVSREYLERI